VAVSSAIAAVRAAVEVNAMPIARRLAITNPDNAGILLFDITEIDNANTQFPIQFAVQTQCDLGHWHEDSRTDIPIYGERIANANRGNRRRDYPNSPNAPKHSGSDLIA
jgi:hypothetical protein